MRWLAGWDLLFAASLARTQATAALVDFVRCA